MHYFKHYHNADSSIFIQKVVKEHGLLGYAHWNLLLELMCEKFDGKSILIKLTIQEIAIKLRAKSSRVHSIITSFSELGDNQVITKLESSNNRDNLDGFIIIISAPILVDLQDRDFRYARSERVASDAKNKIKKENKNKIKIKKEDLVGAHEKFNEEFFQQYLLNVKIKTQEAWMTTYPDHEWLKSEVMRSITWLINEGETRKDMGKYISGWLGRSKKTSKSTEFGKFKKLTTSEIVENQLRDYYNEVGA